MDTTNAHTVVENQTIDPIGFHPPFNNGTTTWTVSPALPGNLSINGSTGEITGSVNATLSNRTYTVTATHSGSGSGSASGSGGGSGGGSGTGSSFVYANDKLSAGGYHTCAILDNGDLKCWGWDSNGQLGNGATTGNVLTPPSTVIDLGTGRTAVAVSSGTYHTCAVLDNGDVKCWGRDDHGQLGDGGTNTATNAPSSTAIDLGTGRTAVAASVGQHHTCAILDNGDMKLSLIHI